MSKPAKKPVEPDNFRTCKHCGRDDGRNGPRPAGSMLQLVGNRLEYACSVQCGRALGWRST